ncbi:MAG: carboxynorspermidine decarboxylase [Lentisphaerae bacterium GWF2_52_8]|nr:MAG: carboxynorspermidine decarboxylase [Lentisphaerae bacterium GWF2_52_8]
MLPKNIINEAPSPCFVVDESALQRNLDVMNTVMDRTGCKILLALKGFAMFSSFPLLKKTLKGVCASSPHEARLGREEFGGELHAFAAAFNESDITELLPLCDHIVFNSFSQWRRFQKMIEPWRGRIEFGLRVNPEHSEAPVPIYDPCGPNSRLGIRRAQFDGESLEGIDGLHFHTLCEKDADALERTLEAFEKNFAAFIPKLKWVNFGGGHHISKPAYKLDLLCRLINGFKKRYGVQVYLEPGEAVALNSGVLIATVLDIIENGMPIAILDTSAACHMPDVLEMPYRPNVVGAGQPKEKAYTCRLAGPSCLAGDIIGDYSFDKPLKIGDRLEFLDMAHYSMVKTNTFNGIRLPSIALHSLDGKLRVVRNFGYEDFKNRLS